MPIKVMRYAGYLWFAAGLAVVFGALFLSEGMDKPLLKQPLAVWSAIVAGAMIAAVGLISFLDTPHGPQAREARQAENDFIVSLRLWLIAAAADGVLRDSEVDVIIQNAKRRFGRDVSSEFVRETYELLKERTGARQIDDELFGSKMLLSAEGVRHTLYGSIYVALFDGEMDVEERRVIDELAARFELDADVIDAIIGEVREDLDEAEASS